MSVSFPRPSKGDVRKAVLWVHLWFGLIVGIYFAVISATGSILVFKEDIEMHQMMPERAYVAPPTPGAALLPLSELIARLRPQFPEAREADFAFINPPPYPTGLICSGSRPIRNRFQPQSILTQARSSRGTRSKTGG